MGDWVNFEMTRSGVLPEKLNQFLYLTDIKIDAALHAIANETRDHMRMVIKQKTYRTEGNAGNLQKSIEVEKIENGYGVGNKLKMNQTAPYWYLMNYGGMSTVAARGGVLYGSFGPGNAPDNRLAGSNPGAGSEIFVQGTFPSYAMRPKNPVSAKNYIEITANWASTIWGVMLSEKLTAQVLV